MKVSRKSRQPRHLFLVNAVSCLFPVNFLYLCHQWFRFTAGSCNSSTEINRKCRVRLFLSDLLLCPDCSIKSGVSWQDVSEC